MKALFVGLGSIGQRHLRNLKALKGDDVTCIAFRSKRQVPVLSDDLQVLPGVTLKEAYGVIEYDTLGECLDLKPDIVFITNPSSMHAEVALECAKSGSAIFIEKPLASSLQGIDELCSVCESNNLITFVGFQLRFDKALRQIKQYLDSEQIGTIIGAQFHQAEYFPNWHPYEDYRISYAARKELGGGVILTQIHEIDFILWLLGFPKSVYCVGGKRSSLEIDVEDTASLMLKFGVGESTFPVTINLDYLQNPPRRGGVIIGEHGRITWDFHENSVKLIRSSKDEIISHEFGPRKRNDLFMQEMKHFIDCVEANQQTLIPVSFGKKSLIVATSALESMKSMQPIEMNLK